MNNIQNIRSVLKDLVTGESKKKRKEIEDERVRLEEADDIKLAKNPYLSLREYERLADGPPFVRIALACGCSFMEIIEKFVNDLDPVVRSVVPRNKNISKEIFVRLLKDPSPIVSSRAKEFSKKFN